jgi:hypothetical protein
MKSPMIENATYINDRERYSPLQVLRSGAGWYIGTMYHNSEGYDEPGSRDSGYFATREEAQEQLETLSKLGDGVAASMLRDHP